MEQYTTQRSYFDGGLFEWLGYTILAGFITIFTLGICYPWAVCIKIQWKVKHTVINGKRLVFKGTAIGLFGNWIKWFFLTLITCGIYGFWVNIKMIEWETQNTYFID